MSNIFNKTNATMTLYICEFIVESKSEWAKVFIPHTMFKPYYSLRTLNKQQGKLQLNC